MKNRSWTLIELVMVIVLTAIIALISLPKFDSFYSIKLQSAAKRMLSDIRYTQQLAIARHETYKVYFNTINNSYQVQRSSDSAYATDPFTRANLIINFASDPEHNGVTIPSTTLDSNTVQFDWKGIPLDSLGTALTSEKSVTLAYKGLTRVIYITPATGRVRLQ